jgi:N-acetyl-anhydromuramyl-L-alanine amidase AmpD
MAAPQPKWNVLDGRWVHAGRTPVTGIVLHDTAGTGTHNDTLYLANPSDGRKVCCDFTVERDGSIWKLNPDLDKFYTPHAGRKTKFKGLTNNAVTRATIGIEICQKVKMTLQPLYPQPQVKAVADLCAWLVGKYRLTTSDITTHRGVVTDGSRADPRQFPFDGPNGFWQLYWEAQGQGDIHEVATEMPKIPEPGKKTHTVVQGDTLSGIAKKTLGKASLWKKIADANGLSGTTIVIGQVLTIPNG